MTLPTPRLWLSAAVGLAALAPWANAQNFAYADQNLLLGIRPAAGNASSSSLLLNLGPVANFYNAAPGSSFAIGNAAVVNGAFGSLANLSYSFSAANKSGTGPTALQSIWVAQAREDLSVQSDPWLNKSSGNLANTATKISTLGSGATTLASVAGSSGSAVLIPNSDAGHNVGRWVGSGASGGGGVGNYNGTFQGNAEITSPASFGANASMRSDLYEVTPGAGQSKYLGYFQVNGNGTATFNAPSAVPEPGTVALTVAGLAALVLWRRRSAN